MPYPISPIQDFDEALFYLEEISKSLADAYNASNKLPHSDENNKIKHSLGVSLNAAFNIHESLRRAKSKLSTRFR